MNKSAKRVYTDINRINIENAEDKKFIIDETSFHDDSSQPPTTEIDEHGEYYIIIGRILPRSNIYNQSAFKIKLRVPIEYPLKPPDVQMLTPIYHPNIGPEGKICIGLIRSTKSWTLKTTLHDVINAIIEYIDCPNIDEAYSSEIAEEFLKRRNQFNQKATEFINRNMLPRQ